MLASRSIRAPLAALALAAGCGTEAPAPLDPDAGEPVDETLVGEPCTNDLECGGLKCVAGFCADEISPVGRPCVRTSDCRAEEYCDVISGKCKPCDIVHCRPPDGGPADAGPRDAGPADSGPADAGSADAGPADSGPADAGAADSGPADAGAADSGPADAGSADAGPADSGPADAGAADSGPADAGSADAGPADSGPPDSGPVDAGPADSGPPDSGPVDAGPADSGPPDSGPVDSGPWAAPIRPRPGDLRFAEVFQYPYDAPYDDLNLDGFIDRDDQFIELVNITDRPIDIGGFSIYACNSSNYIFGAGQCDDLCGIFPEPFVIQPKKAVLVFGKIYGNSASVLGSAPVYGCAPDSLGLDLSETATQDWLQIRDQNGAHHWGVELSQAPRGESVVWYPELSAVSYSVTHRQAPGSGGRWYSPGTLVDGTPY